MSERISVMPAAAQPLKDIQITAFDPKELLPANQNIKFTPTAWWEYTIDNNVVNLLDFCVGDGVADDTAGVVAAFAAAGINGTIICPGGYTFLMQGVGGGDVLAVMQTGQKLIGTGTFKLNNHGSRMIRMVQDCVIDGCSFIGMTTFSQFECGIVIFSFSRWRISNCTFSLFGGQGTTNGGGGILVADTFTGNPINTTASLIQNCKFFDSFCGLNIDIRAEYIEVTNCTSNGNVVGLNLFGGNNKFSSCNFDSNGTNLNMGAGANNSHGAFVNCSFNHATTKIFTITDSPLGMTFTNCFFYGIDADITNSTGFVFINCQFARSGGVAVQTITATNCFKICVGFSKVSSDPMNGTVFTNVGGEAWQLINNQDFL